MFQHIWFCMKLLKNNIDFNFDWQTGNTLPIFRYETLNTWNARNTNSTNKWTTWNASDDFQTFSALAHLESGGNEVTRIMETEQSGNFWVTIFAMLSNRRSHSIFLEKRQPAAYWHWEEVHGAATMRAWNMTGHKDYWLGITWHRQSVGKRSHIEEVSKRSDSDFSRCVKIR